VLNCFVCPPHDTGDAPQPDDKDVQLIVLNLEELPGPDADTIELQQLVFVATISLQSWRLVRRKRSQAVGLYSGAVARK
jgi:hypothetical protein